MRTMRLLGTSVSCGVLCLAVLAAALPSVEAFGFSSTPVAQCRMNLCGRSTARRPALRASAWRMDRKDGGAGKIPSKPGGGGGVGDKPGQGAGDGGAAEKDGRGAGVAVLTKPPDVDKVLLVLFCVPCLCAKGGSVSCFCEDMLALQYM
jgi:hypothetical protein